MRAIIENAVFKHRWLVLLLFALLTIFMAYSATNLRLHAGFKKLLPVNHEYMQTFFEYQKDFGGANRILIAVSQKDGDIFNPEFFDTLKKVTDEVFFIQGIERSSVTSLFTPNVRFTEVVEGGFAGGNVIPSEFRPTPEWFDKVRENILKSGKLGRLVSSDFQSAIVAAELVGAGISTAGPVDYINIAEKLEDIRTRFNNENTDIHIIGFAKLIGDIVDGLVDVGIFFIITLLVTTLLLFLYTRSIKLTILPLVCSITAVIWQLGLLPLIGYGIDPMSILVPFLVFAIGISHGVQMVNAVKVEARKGADSITASRAAFSLLLIPGSVALISDTLGFLTILLIEIEIIREMAIAASLGIAVILLTNLFLLPVLLSFVPVSGYQKSLERRGPKLAESLSGIFSKRSASYIIAISAGLLVFGLWYGKDLRIGDLEAGAPELHADSRYNRDIGIITSQFAIGVDVLTIVAESSAGACTDYSVMETIDHFTWTMRNTEGVHAVLSLPVLAKIVNAGWNEGNLKWRVLSRNNYVLAQSVYPFDTSTGLLNSDCGVMAVHIYTKDHKAETITRIIDAARQYQNENTNNKVKFRLASGNVGVMAATNEAVSVAQIPMLVYVYAAIILLCVLAFLSLRGTLCIVIPLALVSVLTYALMVSLDIGLKVATLPVVALGVGIGVDYGIYIYSRLNEYLKAGKDIQSALNETFKTTGNAVLFTAFTLAIGVSTWIFSTLKFQADMGTMLTFVFLANMLGAMLLLPALAVWIMRK